MPQITLSTNRATAARFIAAFSRLHQQLTIPAIPHKNIPQLPTPVALPTRGIDVLMDVGRACTRLTAKNDPAHLFALVRYATNISPKSTGFALTNAIHALDPHKKAVLSDEFGCGLSLSISRQIFGATLFIDMHDAIQRGWMKPKKPKSNKKKIRCPDFFGRTNNQGILIVEAKGTLGSETFSKSQVNDGCQQAASVNPKNFGSPVTARIAVGTALRHDSQRNPTKIFVSDPDEQEGIQIEPHGSFEISLIRNHYLRLSTLIGDSDLANRLEEDVAREFLQRDSMDSRIFDNAHFTGKSIAIDDDKFRLSIFAGISTDIREILLTTPNATLADKLEKISHLGRTHRETIPDIPPALPTHELPSPKTPSKAAKPKRQPRRTRRGSATSSMLLEVPESVIQASESSPAIEEAQPEEIAYRAYSDEGFLIDVNIVRSRG